MQVIQLMADAVTEQEIIKDLLSNREKIPYGISTDGVKFYINVGFPSAVKSDEYVGLLKRIATYLYNEGSFKAHISYPKITLLEIKVWYVSLEFLREKIGYDVKETEIQRLRDAFNRWLYLEDQDYLNVVLALFISHRIPDDPVWMFIVGPSSDCKTEMLRAFTTEDTVLTQSISSKTLISGFNPKDRERTNYDLAPRLHDKIWVIYDFSEMLSKDAKERNEIFSQLRSLYDGTVSKTFGTGMTARYGTGKEHDPRINCTLVAASTPVIDSYLLEQQLLGTRHLFYRINTKNTGQVMAKISENDEKSEIMRSELNKAVKDFLDTVTVKEVEISTETDAKIRHLTEFMITMRAGVHVDQYTDEVTNIAYPEKPGRAYKMLRKLYKALKHIPDLTEEDCLRILKKVVFSTVPEKRILVLKQLLPYRDEEATCNQTAKPLRLGNRTVRRELNALWQLNYVDKREEYDHDQKREISYYKINEDKCEYLKEVLEGKQETLGGCLMEGVGGMYLKHNKHIPIPTP